MGMRRNTSKHSDIPENDFENQLTSFGFTHKSIAELIKNGFETIDNLKLLNNKEDIAQLDLTMAQRLLQKKTLSDITKQVDVELKPTGVSTVSQNIHDILTELAAENPQGPHETHSGRLSAHPAPSQTTNYENCRGTLLDPRTYLYNHPEGGSVKFLDIADFVILVPLLLEEHADFVILVPPLLEEQVLSEGNGTELVMRSAVRKPKLQNISIEDWCLANTRIMDVMYSSGCLNSYSIRDYMAYTMKICELFRVYDRVSDLQYDREYRYKQACTNFRWGTDIQHLLNIHLLIKPVLQSVLTRQAWQCVPFTPASESNELCRLCNSGRGCRKMI